MKKLVLVVAAMAWLAGVAFFAGYETATPVVRNCPVPRITVASIDCFKCHIEGDFRVKETAADAHRVYPVEGMRVVGSEGHFVLYNISSPSVSAFFDYLDAQGIKKAVMEIHSGGGLFGEAQRIVGIMRYWQGRGGTVETRLYGIALSAGFYVFVAGDVRLVDRYAYLMWHTVQFPGFIETPELVRAKKHIMKILNTYLATRGKLTKVQLDRKVDNNEIWMSGEEAVEFGFADGLITKAK